MKLIKFFFIIFILLTTSIFSEENYLLDQEISSKILVYIELANPKIYYQDDEIYINIKIFNKSNTDTVFTIANNKIFSFDFDMVTIQNKTIEHSVEYINSFHKVQSVFTSHIILASKEGYVFKARLNDYYDINNPGQFFIRCYFYPDLKFSNMTRENTILSNQLSINIRPSKIEEETIIEKESVEEEKKYYVTKRPPDEVIEYMLTSRMNKEWEKFFLYLDLEKLIMTHNYYRERYLKADKETQIEIINEYKQYLKRDRIDNISFMPTKFEIKKTEYSEGRAKVEALIFFKYQDYDEKKYYTYFLNKKGNIWYVSSYEVLNFK